MTGYENDNGTQLVNPGVIVFDEFIPRGGSELPDEVSLYFYPCISSIRRRCMDTEVVLLGNPNSRFSPYLEEFGVDKDMPQGVIRVYQNLRGGKVAVERTGRTVSKDDLDKFYSFGNRGDNTVMSGGWELAVYPRPPKYKPREVVNRSFFSYGEYCIQCDIVYKEESIFCSFFPCSFDKVGKYDRLYTVEWNESINAVRDITRSQDPLSLLIMRLLNSGRGRYATNLTGNTIDSYLNWCRSNGGPKIDKM